LASPLKTLIFFLIFNVPLKIINFNERIKMRKYLLSTLMLVTTSFVIADGHTPAEKKVLDALETYFEARNNQDWKTVVAYESNSGTYGTNSDGSFHKPVVIQSEEDWANSSQGGTLNIHYPEAIQLSEDVVHVRFYYEGIIETAGVSKPYRTRVTMNWVNERDKWVAKTQHFSSATYGGVHISQSSDFED
jgi:hypothetical protein